MAQTSQQNIIAEIKRLEQENFQFENQIKEIQKNYIENPEQVLFQRMEVIQQNEKEIESLQVQILDQEFKKNELNEQIGNLETLAFQNLYQYELAVQKQEEQKVYQSLPKQQQLQNNSFFNIPSIFDQSSPRISNLQKLYNLDNVDSEALSELNDKYSDFREVREDGNQHYRAVGFALLEHFCKPATSIQALQSLINNYKQESNYFSYKEKYEDLRIK